MFHNCGIFSISSFIYFCTFIQHLNVEWIFGTSKRDLAPLIVLRRGSGLVRSLLSLVVARSECFFKVLSCLLSHYCVFGGSCYAL